MYVLYTYYTKTRKFNKQFKKSKTLSTITDNALKNDIFRSDDVGSRYLYVGISKFLRFFINRVEESNEFIVPVVYVTHITDSIASFNQINVHKT